MIVLTSGGTDAAKVLLTSGGTDVAMVLLTSGETEVTMVVLTSGGTEVTMVALTSGGTEVTIVTLGSDVVTGICDVALTVGTSDVTFAGASFVTLTVGASVVILPKIGAVKCFQRGRFLPITISVSHETTAWWKILSIHHMHLI